MARAAAAAALLERNLNSLSGTAVRSSRGTTNVTRDTDAMSRSMDKGGASINQLTGRLSLLASAAGLLGPSLIPIAAIGVPALTGLAAQFGFAAVGAGTAVVAFQGVGTALKAMNKAALEPTAENLQAAQAAMEEISPAAQDFVTQLRDMAPAMKQLRDTAAEGMFPGLTEGLQSMESLLPKVERILGAVSGELGDIAAESGASLASDRWSEFFDFLATDAPSALADMAAAAGNTGHALAEMWMAFDPLNDDFSSWMVDATADLDTWATGLSQTQGFAEFVDYLRTTGPQVADTLGAVANALVQIVQAAAPVGGPILAGIEAFAKAIGAIADSDLGTPIFGMVAALSALNLAMRTSAALSKTSFGGPMMTGIRNQSAGLKTLRADWAAYSAVQRTAQGRAQATAGQMIASRDAAAKLGTSLKSHAAAAGKAGAAVAGLAVLTTGAGESMGITNTASLALMGSMGGPWGAALGAAAGAAIDLSHANDDLRDSVTSANAALDTGDIDLMASAYADLGKKVKETNDVGFWDPRDADAGLKKILAHVTGATGDAKESQSNLAAAGAADMMFKMSQNAAIAGQAAAAGFNVTAAGADEAAMSVKELTAALAAANAAMNAISGEDALRTAVLDARALAKEGGKVLTDTGKIMKGQERAGIAARGALVGMGSAAQTAGEQMKAGFAKTKFLDDKRKDFVNIAMAMGLTRGAARRMADDFGLIDSLHAKPKVTEEGADASKNRVRALDTRIKGLKGKIVQAKENGATESSKRVRDLRAKIAELRDRRVKIIAETAAARAAAAGLVGYINSLSGTVTIRTRRVGGIDALVQPADGGTIPRFDPGGTVPGQRHPYGDRVPALLAPGEEVISNRHGQADRYRAILKAINANAYASGGTVQRLADGGTARRRNNDNDGANTHMKRLTKALNALKGSVDKQTAARDAIVAKRSELAGGVTDKFRTDLFGESNAWAAGGGAGGAIATLKADIAKANTFKSLLYSLSKKGLDGDAMAELAGTGDVGKAQAFASMSKANLGTYESLYNQRASASAGVGAYAGMAAYSAQQAAAQAQLVKLNGQVAAMTRQIRGLRGDGRGHAKNTGREVAKGVNSTTGPARRHKKGKVG